MADNFLERKQEEFLRLKSSGGEARRRRWLKQLKAHQERLKAQAAEAESSQSSEEANNL